MDKVYPIDPTPAPRQTRRDTWSPSPSVLRYRAFKDEVKARKVFVPEDGACMTFVIAMPRSWSKKKRAEMDGKKHKQKPDLDNLIKALLDAIYSDDCAISSYSARKVWGQKGQIIIQTDRRSPWQLVE